MNDPCPQNLAPRAFTAVPDPNRYFPAAVIEEARQKVARSIERGEGPAMIVGAPGIGKTMLLEVLAEQFRGQLTIVSLPGSQLCSRRALLQMILFQAGLPYQGIEEGELRVSLLSYLRPQDGPARRMLLLVDEADSLPSRLLEEVRVLTNVADRGQPLVSLVLAGSSTLEERFAEPRMEALSQRISTRCYLSAFGREESFQYIRAQVAAIGSDPDQLFSVDGLEAMFATTDGVPRLLNQLGDQLMWMTQETGYAPLDGTIVQQAWSELQQLPAPWNSTPANIPSDAATVFDDLTSETEDSLEDVFVDELEDDLPASIPIHAPQQPASFAPQEFIPKETEERFVETFDATQQLMEQLQEIESSGRVSIPQKAAEPELSQNPFQESFETEEVVLDRYVTFETHLLATAQRVVNQVDTAFSQQLSHCEVIETPVVTSYPEKPLTTLDTAPQPIGPIVPATLEESTLAVGAMISDSLDAANVPSSSEPGSLLVVEDQDRSNITVVPGDKFRHLFSSLESGSNVPCMGS